MRKSFAIGPLLTPAAVIACTFSIPTSPASAQATPAATRPATPSGRAGATGFPGRGFPGMGRGAALPPGAKAQTDIRYVEDGHPNQVLNLYLPEQPAQKPLPLMIWIHGGAWMAGSHANPPVLPLVTRGFAVASIQYRFSSHAIWPAQAHDCKAALRFLRANAAKYNLDSDRFAVGGDSAGGHLAAFLGTSANVQAIEGNLGNPGVPTHVSAVVDWFGPTDLLVMGKQAGPNSMIQHDSADSPESRLVGGPIQERKDLAKSADPLTYIDKDDPPFLIMHGDNDQLVPLGQSQVLADALRKAGVDTTFKVLPGAGHGDPQFRTAENMKVLEDFLRQKLKFTAP